ncbi:MAG: exonuclease domain-containing protein [Bacillota bacterium]
MLNTLLQKVKGFFLPQPENGCPDADTAKEIRETIARNNKKIPPSALLDDLRFVVMDLETTGFEYGNGDEIIAVGAVTVRNGQIRREEYFHQFVYPYRLVPGKVVNLTGIGREMLVGCPSFLGILPQFLEFIGTSVLVGHCVDFDLGFINSKIKKCCQAKIKNRALDTAVLARALYPAEEDYSLDSLLALYAIEPAGRHSALGDALLTAQLFVNLLARLKEQKVYTLEDLDQFLKQHLQLGQQDLVFIR